MRTVQNKVDSSAYEAGKSHQEWVNSIQDGVTKMYQSATEEQRVDLVKAQSAATRQGIDLSKAQIGAMAYSVQAAGMNADALRKIGVAPMVIDAVMKVLETVGRIVP
jgi:hypothetical protein